MITPEEVPTTLKATGENENYPNPWSCRSSRWAARWRRCRPRRRCSPCDEERMENQMKRRTQGEVKERP